MIETQRVQIADLTRQLEWFRRQVFGQKSERLAVLENALQLSLSQLPLPEPPAPVKTRTVAAHTRRLGQRDAVGESESVPFFDESGGADGEQITLMPRARGSGSSLPDRRR